MSAAVRAKCLENSGLRATDGCVVPGSHPKRPSREREIADEKAVMRGQQKEWGKSWMSRSDVVKLVVLRQRRALIRASGTICTSRAEQWPVRPDKHSTRGCFVGVNGFDCVVRMSREALIVRCRATWPLSPSMEGKCAWRR
eukprot:2920194-Rhodomonas_salina.1